MNQVNRPDPVNQADAQLQAAAPVHSDAEGTLLHPTVDVFDCFFCVADISAGTVGASKNDQMVVTVQLPGAIGDYVWIDANGDGIQDTGESGLDGVTVKLYDGSHNLKGTTTTSGGGFYIFEDLQPGDYYLEFVRPADYDFSSKDQGGDDAIDSDVYTTTGKTDVTTLDAGETDLTWDAGLHLCKIGDRVWHDSDSVHNGIQEEFCFPPLQCRLI